MAQKMGYPLLMAPNIFVRSNFYIQFFVFLLNLVNYTHFKLSNQLLQVSVGCLSPDLPQFYYKINFHKIFNFVKEKNHQIKEFE